jgi:hypothetical protein
MYTSYALNARKIHARLVGMGDRVPPRVDIRIHRYDAPEGNRGGRAILAVCL